MGQLIHLHVARKILEQSLDSEQALQRALDERAQFLDTYPQYRVYQQEIDRMMDKSGSMDNRMSVIALLMESKLVEMHNQLKIINSILRQTT